MSIATRNRTCDCLGPGGRPTAGHCTFHRDQFITQNLGLVRYLVGRRRRSFLSEEDQLQVAHLALCEAVDDFDPQRGFQFSTFAGRVITNALNTQEAKARAIAERERSLDGLRSADEGDYGQPLVDTLPDPRAVDPETVAVDRGALETVLAYLPRREAVILRLRYGLDDGISRTSEEVAGILGTCGRARVGQLELRALGKLRKLFGGRPDKAARERRG